MFMCPKMSQYLPIYLILTVATILISIFSRFAITLIRGQRLMPLLIIKYLKKKRLNLVKNLGICVQRIYYHTCIVTDS